MENPTVAPAVPPRSQLPISCFIIALNEADRITATITSVRDLVEEIIVIDSGSTDGTVAVATAAGARVIHNAWPGFGQQKRFAEDQCRNSWLLNLDADEVLSERLRNEIRGLFVVGEPALAAYGMWAQIVYPGHTKPRPFARDLYVHRLYDRRKVRFADKTLHDSVEVGGLPVGRFDGDLLHFSVRSLDDLIAKGDERAGYNALHAKPKSRGQLALRIVTEFPLSFLKFYLLRLHFTGGLMGFQYSMILAFYRFVRMVRMYARTRTDG